MAQPAAIQSRSVGGAVVHASIAGRPERVGGEVMRRLLLAAEQGDASAQFNLGVLYDNRLDDNNRPFAGNRALAMKWLLYAADQGLPRAQIKLAGMYTDPREAPADYVKACAWLLLAAEHSSGIYRQTAQSDYTRISSRMTPAQIGKARRFARDWKPKRRGDVATPKSPEIS
jgi:Sel1 repeat-containing protein